MRDFPIRLRASVDCNEVERIIDEALIEAGLSVTLRGSLKKFPGCIHWHASNGRQSGTLEVTLWPGERRAWFTIQDGRAAPWIAAKMKLLQAAIRRRLASK